MRSDAQKKADRRYETKRRSQYKVVGAKVPRVEAEQFAAACKANGTTPNAVLSERIREYLGAHK